MAWWRDGVLYQIYPRSFSDSDGDGIGDLRGVVSKLDYLAWLGVSGIWLNPIFPSPNVDWGYDVSDYFDVHPDLGTLEDLDLLVREAGTRGIRVLLDLVPNHTSDRHPWFRERPDFYVRSERVPNNWRSFFTGGSAWSADRAHGGYYLHLFAPEQPDLDWHNPAVCEEFERILRFWFGRGVAGFRIDVAHALVKDRERRDDTLFRHGDPDWVRQAGRWFDRSLDQPEIHELYRGWHRITEEFDPRPILVGETYVHEVERMAAYYGTGEDELDLAFNFTFLNAPFEAEALRAVVEEVEQKLPARAWPVYTVSNHDHSRAATRWAEGDERRARAVLFLLLTLRGTPFLYQGDEIALLDGAVPPDRILDVATPPRDPCRTPLPWAASGDEWQDPWLPLVDTSRNVDEQRADPDSTLAFVRALVERRRAFVREPYRSLPSRPGVWAFARGDTTCVANLSADESEHDGRRLAPWECLAFSGSS